VAIGVFGVFVPLRQGLDFFDVMFLLAYACLPCLFAAPLVAESVASRRPEPAEIAYKAQILMPVLFATAWSYLILGSGLVTVNAANWFGRMVLPPMSVLVNVMLLSLALTLLASAGTGWLSLNVSTPKVAKAQARRAFLLVLVLVLLWSRMSPPSWRSEVALRLTADRIGELLLPVSLVLVAGGFGLMQLGARRRKEEAAGPLLRLE
jgi:hypothetical protein